MESCKITYIYGLYEVGKEDVIRYVGKSDNLKKRLKDHRNDKRKTSHKSCWISSVTNRGCQIGIKAIQVVSEDNWKEMEMYWISEMRKKFDLVNNTDGGDGGKKSVFLSYDECRDWIKSFGIKGMKEYKMWSKQKDFPIFLPKAPNRVFVEWTSWGNYLNTGSIHTMNRKKQYLSYVDAKKYLKDNFNIKNSVDFRIQRIPIFIPKKPYRAYKEWLGWEDFLGYKRISRKKDHKYLSYDDAKKWIKNNNNAISASKFRHLSKNGLINDSIPKKPEKYYRKEWISWQDFLSNNNIQNGTRKYISYEEIRKIAHLNGIKSHYGWKKLISNSNLNAPKNPQLHYKEWVSWSHFLTK